jgi:hypothetical protein
MGLRIMELTAELHDAQRPGVEAALVQHDQWQQVVIPALHKNEGADGRQDWRRKRQSEPEEEADIVTAIDIGCLEQLPRQLLKETAQKNDGEGHRESRLRQDNAQWIVEQIEIANLDEERHDRCRKGEHESQEQVRLYVSGTEEPDLGKHISCHRRG